MERIILYTDGDSLSPTEHNGWKTAEFVRLIADDGKAITDGISITDRIDTTHPDNWADCNQPEEELTAEEALAELVEVLA